MCLHDLFQPQRADGLQARLDEFTPTGMDVGIIFRDLKQRRAHMKSDATRDTFDPAKHLSRVIMQQGRVALDADHNEQVSIFWEYLRALAQDVIGPHAAPAAGGGFNLTVDAKGGLSISAGRYYVEGLLVDSAVDCLYTAQPSYAVPAGDPLVDHDAMDNDAALFVYLDVCERHITRIEDASLREVALGGPDTCPRARVVWQVKVAKIKAGDIVEGACSTQLGPLLAQRDVSMAAFVDPGKVLDEPCVMPPESKFRGAENQLYRVEIHEAGTAGNATFKWSRDNGSVFTALGTITGEDLEVASARGFVPGDWIELTNDTHDLRGEPGLLIRLAKVQGATLSIDPEVPATGAIDILAGLHPKVRRWNQARSEDVVLRDGAVLVPAASTTVIDLEDGVQVRFSGAGEYRTGDYWQIPARVATGKLEWPTTPGAKGPEAVSLAPRSITHHYAPLGFVTWSDCQIEVSRSCRCTFTPTAVCPK